MSAGNQAGVHTIHATLIKGHHDALLDIYHQHSRRLANLMILRISEACQDRWPLSMADYTPPPRPLTDAIKLKITVRGDLFPKLFQRYEVLPRTGRSNIFVNMLNRHVNASIGAPQEVEKEMLKLDVPQLAGDSQPAAPLLSATEEIPSPSNPAEGRRGAAEIVMSTGLVSQSQPAQQEPIIATEEDQPLESFPQAVEQPDPLDDFNCGL